MAKDDRLYGKFTLDFADSPKILPLSDAAFRALVEMTLYSRRMLTDGFIPDRLALARWGLEACQELLGNDHEKPSLNRVENGYVIHDFAKHQGTKAEIEARREVRRAAGQKGGLAKARANALAKPKQTSSKTCPETETETVSKSNQKPATDTTPDGFDEWWQAYPKKVGKGQARTAYKAATKKATVPELLAGAIDYAATPGLDPQYTANPATWLNGERWADEKQTGGPRKIAGGLFQE